MNGFQKQKTRGQEAEQIVKRHLESRGHTIEDVTNIPYYWNIDIDFIITNKDTINSTTLEVKRDDNIFKTGNLFFEIGFDKDTHYSEGWLEKCKAEYICFYDALKRQGIIVNFKRIKPILSSLGREITFWDREDQCYGNALLVPLSKARYAGVVAYEWSETA